MLPQLRYFCPSLSTAYPENLYPPGHDPIPLCFCFSAKPSFTSCFRCPSPCMLLSRRCTQLEKHCTCSSLASPSLLSASDTPFANYTAFLTNLLISICTVFWVPTPFSPVCLYPWLYSCSLDIFSFLCRKARHGGDTSLSQTPPPVSLISVPLG